MPTTLGKAIGAKVEIAVRDTHAVLSLPIEKLDAARKAVRKINPRLRIMGAGDAIEIYKEVGYPTDVSRRFDLAQMTGTHGIGHTRMATESAVTTLGAHPFSTGAGRMPRPQRLAVEPQQSSPRADP